jgi:hypothetical protein
MAITLANITINRISSRGTVTRRGDGGAIERVLTLSGRTSKRFNTLAEAKAIEVQLHELVWYSRQAGGLYVNSSEFDVDDGLYILDSVDTSTAVDAQTTYIIDVDLSLIRLGGVSANVSRTLYAQASLQTNDWSITSNLWYALPVGASILTLPTAQKIRVNDDGNVYQPNTTTSQAYVMTGADHNAGECKVWDTGGGNDPNTVTAWNRVYSPDHQFADIADVAFGNGFVTFLPYSSNYGQHGVWVYDTVDAGWVMVGTDLSVGGANGTGWTRVLIEELTPWRVVLSFWYAKAAAPFIVKKRMTLERGKLVALIEVTVSSSANIAIGAFGQGSGLRFLFGNDTTNDRNDAWDGLYDTSTLSISDTDDNWLAARLTEAGRDVLALVAVRDNSYELIADATLDAIYSQRTSTTTHEVYVGGLAYDTTKLAIEAEAGTLTGTAAITTVASASPGGSNNAVTLPALNDQVQTFGSANPPALTGTSSITVKAYARVQNVGVSASDTCRIGIYNTTTATHVATKDFTFAVLAASATWKWISIDYTGWNGTDTISPYVKRQVAGGAGTLYVDELLFVTLSSNAGADGPLYLAHAALTEATVWSENSRVGV